VFAGLLIAIMSLASIGVEAVCEQQNYRFSLRALLITTTLVALALRLIGYLNAN
jgi:hypothetical protein